MPKKKSSVNDVQKSNRIIIHPKTATQKHYLRELDFNSQVFAVGPAGTGKTFIPTMVAIKAYLRGEVTKIILSRPAVAAGGEEHGFLPGSLEKKLAPWTIPVTELMIEFMGKERFQDMLKSGDLEVTPFTYMRGRTFRDCFVILDEAQNTTPEQMKLFLTRLGDNSRVVVCGDVRQNDMKGSTGLATALELAKKFNIPVGIVEFTKEDVVRSDLCKFWVNAFEES